MHVSPPLMARDQPFDRESLDPELATEGLRNFRQRLAFKNGGKCKGRFLTTGSIRNLRPDLTSDIQCSAEDVLWSKGTGKMR